MRDRIAAHALIIKSLGRKLRFGIPLNNLGIPPLGICKVLFHIGHSGEAHFEKHPELVPGQLALEPRALFAIPIHYHYGRGPGRIEAMKVSWVLFYVNVERDKVFVDK